METNRIHGKPLICSLAAWLAIEGGAFLILGESGFSLQSVAVVRIMEIIAWSVIFRLHDNHLKNLGLDPGRWKTSLIRGFLWAAGFGLVAMLAAVVIRMTGHNPIALLRVHMPVQGRQIALLILAGGLIGPIAEEIFFRGILQGYFRRWGMLTAIFLTTLLFAMAHYPSVSPVQVIGGILFSVAYEIEGDLTVPIIIHATGNTAIYMVSWLL